MNIIESKVKAKEYKDYKKRLRSIECSKKSKYLDNNLDPIIINRTNNKFALLKENQMNSENRILMSKLQKILLPDPRQKIEYQVHLRDSMMKRRCKSQKNKDIDRQVEIAIENERIRQKLFGKKSRYNFNNSPLSQSSKRMQKNESCLWNDAVDYAGTLSRTYNNRDVIFGNDDFGNQLRNNTSCETLDKKRNQTYNKENDSQSSSDSRNRSIILQNKNDKNNTYKLPSKDEIVDSYMTENSLLMKSEIIRRERYSQERSSRGRKINPKSFNAKLPAINKKLNNSEIVESKTTLNNDLPLKSPTDAKFLNKTYNVQNS